jgi:hypothetical protein
MPTSNTIAIEVDDDSILAQKQLTIRPIQKMKQKHLRALQRVMRMGRRIDAEHLDEEQVFELLDALSSALQGLLIGWTPADIEELTMDEMLLVYNQLGNETRHAVPNGRSSSSTPRSSRTTQVAARTGSTPSS